MDAFPDEQEKNMKGKFSKDQVKIEDVPNCTGETCPTLCVGRPVGTTCTGSTLVRKMLVISTIHLDDADKIFRTFDDNPPDFATKLKDAARGSRRLAALRKLLAVEVEASVAPEIIIVRHEPATTGGLSEEKSSMIIIFVLIALSAVVIYIVYYFWSSANRLQAGDRVRVKDVRDIKKSFNGQQGALLEFTEGRWRVLMDSSNSTNLFYPSNLEKIDNDKAVAMDDEERMSGIVGPPSPGGQGDDVEPGSNRNEESYSDMANRQVNADQDAKE